jgi:hypothetical protein
MPLKVSSLRVPLLGRDLLELPLGVRDHLLAVNVRRAELLLERIEGLVGRGRRRELVHASRRESNAEAT